ncbi:hypothetical protein AURDEDRAFT_170050 [Auricularia subglabra TFB-10046 SS5]|uniref:Uncharacterized protein n=1 Tax=Auricularia subglabra (strain TFB-10046 / SS5) TaxID=717982 RepID=J0D292_AURST|nr:hypothetical protein AURDEDRAFT_170050 [Auricularia subglabra TFB-10046 SS5]
MPNDGSRSKIPCIPFCPRSSRFLKTIVPIEKAEFETLVNNYVAAMPPVVVADSDLHHFALPHPKSIMCPKVFHRDIDFHQFTCGVLNATRALVHLVDSTAVGYGLGPDEHGEMLCGWYNMNWGKEHPVQHHLTSVELVTVTMPAWCFGEQDMLEFTNAQPFGNPGSREEASQSSAATNLWARLHDFCYLHDAHYFLVTTYNQWTFGCFSNLRSTGYVAPAMKFDARIPNVVQSVMFAKDPTSVNIHFVTATKPCRMREQPMFWLVAHNHTGPFSHARVREENESKLGRNGKRKVPDDRDDDDGCWKRRRASGDMRRAFRNVPWLLALDAPPPHCATGWKGPAASRPPFGYKMEFMRFEALSSSAFAVASQRAPIDHQRPELATSDDSAMSGSSDADGNVEMSHTGARVDPQATQGSHFPIRENPAWFFRPFPISAFDSSALVVAPIMPVVGGPVDAHSEPMNVDWGTPLGRVPPVGGVNPGPFPKPAMPTFIPRTVFQQPTAQCDAHGGPIPDLGGIAQEAIDMVL